MSRETAVLTEWSGLVGVIMEFRSLGRTGLQVSRIAFGAGPVPALMTDAEGRERQRAVIRRALDVGINWFDTAATYGEGRSEESLGRMLADLGAADQVHLATKVRIPPERIHEIPQVVCESFEGSLRRLRVEKVTLLQVHNSITRNRGDQPTSLTPEDVLGPGGVLECFERLRESGRVSYLGFTGLGDPEAMNEVIDSGRVLTVQTPLNVLNRSAMTGVDSGREGEANYGAIIPRAHARGMGTFAIRVFAGGALTGQPPSAHTLTTKFFPLDLYQRDQRQAAALRETLPPGRSLADVALRYVLGESEVTAALVGFAAPEQVDEAVRACEADL